MGRRRQATLSADLLGRAGQVSRKRPVARLICTNDRQLAADLRKWPFSYLTLVPLDAAENSRKVPEGSHGDHALFQGHVGLRRVLKLSGWGPPDGRTESSWSRPERASWLCVDASRRLPDPGQCLRGEHFLR